MTARWALVDMALDDYVDEVQAAGDAPAQFTCAELADLAGTDTHTMGAWLQAHRIAQGRGITRYVVGCAAAGPDAPWRILSMDGKDPKVQRQAREDHTVSILREAVARVLVDRQCEVHPGLTASKRSKLVRDEIDRAVAIMAVVVDTTETAITSGRPPLAGATAGP